MLKWGHEAIRGYKYKITSEWPSQQDSTCCSSFAIDVHPSSFRNSLSLSLQTPAQTVDFSQTILTEYAAQTLLGQKGAYVAVASATPQPQYHIPLHGGPVPAVSKVQYGSVSR